ncbi:MAG: RNA polymerase sigma factor [Nitrososphaerales archaeon]
MENNKACFPETELGGHGHDDGKPHPSIETNLVTLAQRGDGAAFSKLIQPYLRLLYHVALRITSNREDAEDASQECLLKAYLRLNQFKGNSLFSSWLTRIAINEALMKLRKRRSEELRISHDVDLDWESTAVKMLCPVDDLSPEALYSRWERILILREAIENLGAGTRAVVWLLGIEEHKTNETANILRLSESAVKSRFLRGRQQLRECLEDGI